MLSAEEETVQIPPKSLSLSGLGPFALKAYAFADLTYSGRMISAEGREPKFGVCTRMPRIRW